jgi:hypothetical protein
MSTPVRHWIIWDLYFSVLIVMNERIAQYITGTIANISTTYSALTDKVTNPSIG